MMFSRRHFGGWIAGLLVSVLGASVQAEGIFADKNLEAVVRQYVFEKRNNQEPLTEKDVENLSTIEGKGKGITNLSGLEHCHSLALLDLEGNNISDLAPLKDLTNIQSLNLAKNQVQDLAPLAELVKLQYLHLAENQIADLRPLEKLTNMRSLYLSKNRLEDVSVLAKMPKVWSLYLDGNQVKDLKPLSELKWLSDLDLRSNGVTDLAPLAGLSELSGHVRLEGNQITDVGVLVQMAEKDDAGDRRFAPFWNLYLGENPLSEDARNKQLPLLKELGARLH